jgi:hypothetical protein
VSITGIASIEFVRVIVQMRRSRWLLALEIVLFLSYFEVPLLDIGVLGGSYPSLLFALAMFFVPSLVVFALLPLVLFWAALRGNRDARLFVPPFAFIGLLNCWNFLTILSIVFPRMLRFPSMPSFHFGSYTADLWDLWDTVYCVTMLLFLVLRTIGIARERAQAAAELEAARTVQQVLIPEEIPSVPGFAILSVYRPAGQVGGDFFQILRTGTGGVLAVIGDVSGKGMPAAMTVSLLVGTVRTLAHYTQSPREILAAMNQRMLARSGGGFTTCLVLRADATGTLTIANAGHISPYLAGKELALNNGLPLGLAADAAYSESTFQLPPGEQLTLFSDGVVEARSEKGELLGFDRLAQLSLKSATEIADTAKAFGQDDDITVLTLAFTPLEVAHA